MLFYELMLLDDSSPHARDILGAGILAVLQRDIVHDHTPRLALITQPSTGRLHSPPIVPGRIDSECDCARFRRDEPSGTPQCLACRPRGVAASARVRSPGYITVFALICSWRLFSRRWARRIISSYFSWLVYASVFGDGQGLYEFSVDVSVLGEHVSLYWILF